MKMVWPTVWPGAAIACTPGRNSWPSLKNTMRSRTGSRFLRAWTTKSFSVAAQLAFVGPEIEIALRDVELRVGK